MIKAVLLDVDNTLLDFHKCAEASIKAALEECGIRYEQSMFPVFCTINDALWREIEMGRLTREELYQLRGKRIFEALGIEQDGARFDARFRHYLADSAEAVEGAGELLAYLAGKYTVCVASNAPYGQQVRRLERAGMLNRIQKLFVSEKIGFSKPHKAFFDACFAELAPIKPEEAMLVGDSLTADIAGGAAYGIKTCWYNYGHVPVPENSGADYVVDSLPEIKSIL